MTVSQAIIKWLKTFRSEDLPHMRQIDTDLMHGDVEYALIKEPVTNVRRFISGAEMHREHYQIMARLASQTNTDCEDNGEWLEALTEWISQKNAAGEYPDLERAEVKRIGISTPFHMGSSGQNESLYQMTIYIEYMKKGEKE